MRRTTFASMMAGMLVAAAAGLAACSGDPGGDGGPGQGPFSSRPPSPEQLREAGMDRVTAQWALLRPAAGLPTTDYEGFGAAGDDPVPVQANGAFVVNVFGVRPGTVFATPRDGSATLAAGAPETGIYLTPYAGNGVRMTLASDTSGRTVYAAADSGYVVLDATTTVITTLLSHPATDTQDPSVRVRQLEWMCAKWASGWPAVGGAAAAYDAALAGRRDPVVDPAFDAALGQAMGDVFSSMPDFASSEPAVRTTLAPARAIRGSPRKPGTQLAGFGAFWLWGGAGAGPEEKVAMTVASAGRYATFVELEPVDKTRGKITAKTNAGTAIDTYFTARLIDRSKLPPDSTAHLRPQILDRLPLKDGMVASGILPAKSLWSYLDVVGNAVDWVTQTVGEKTGVLSVSGQFEAREGDLLEIRFFSGGKSYGNDPGVFQHVEQHYAAEAHKAFAHNVAMLTTESILLIPGADVVLGEDLIGKVMTAAVTKALTDLQSNAAAQSPEGFASQLLSVCSNAAKVAVDTAIKEAAATKQIQRKGWRKLLSYFTKGGRRLLVSVGKHLSGGKLMKGGCIANRVLRMARPPSIMEYHVVEVGGGACRELMKKAAAEPDHGLLTIGPCTDCLSKACEPQCLEMLKLQAGPQENTRAGPRDACSAGCTAAFESCKVELGRTTTACNQACGNAGRQECMKLGGNAMNSCLARMPFDCMKKCGVTEAVTSKPCLDKMVACEKQCVGGSGAAGDPMEAFYECSQAHCKALCATSHDRPR